MLPVAQEGSSAHTPLVLSTNIRSSKMLRVGFWRGEGARGGGVLSGKVGDILTGRQ